MLDKLLSFFAPHHCCGCDEIGVTLCDNCKYDITSETKTECIICRRPSGVNNLCQTCLSLVEYDRAWTVGDYDGFLKRLIRSYKFERNKSVYKDLAELIKEVLPTLPENLVVVPIPTISRHIRMRGYDHTYLIARRLAKSLGLPCLRILKRLNNTVQVGSSARKREEQAGLAFVVHGGIDSSKTYLLVDDVMTTGATVKHAARKLKEAGAKNVWVAVVARQTLD